MPQSIAECRDLDAWLRPNRLQMIGGIKCEVGMFYEPLVEQRNVLRAVSRIGAEDVEQLDGVGEIALIIRLRRGDDGRGDEIALRRGRLHQEPGAEQLAEKRLEHDVGRKILLQIVI